MRNRILREQAWIPAIALIAALAAMAGCAGPLAEPRVGGMGQMIAPEAAESVALAEYPGTTVMETELAEEDGASYYVVELQSATGVIEVQIDSSTGTLIAATVTADSMGDETEDSQGGDADTNIDVDDDQTDESHEGDEDLSVETDDDQADDLQGDDSGTSIDADDNQIEGAHDGDSGLDIDADDGGVEDAQQETPGAPMSRK